MTTRLDTQSISRRLNSGLLIGAITLRPPWVLSETAPAWGIVGRGKEACASPTRVVVSSVR
jgi:hypothetical protein